MIKYFYMLVVALMLNATVNAQTVLWGNNKDSQFDGGLNGWTTKGLSATPQDSAKNAVWTWTKDGKVTGSVYSANTPQIVGSTFANGAAIMNSDNLETGGVAIGKGKAPGPHKSELISPVFAIPSTEKEISIVFNQYYRNYIANCFVAYSNDGGTTWSSDININSGILVNAATSVRNQRKNIVLKGAVGSPNFRLKFTFDGRLYVWILDDVQVIRSTKYNVTSDDEWFASNHYRVVPKGLNEPFPLMNDVKNNGIKEATNVKLNGKVVNEVTTKVVYDETINLGKIKPGDTLQNTVLPKLVTLTDVGDYTGTYTVSADSTDAEPIDNTISFRTSISDTLYSHEINRTRSLSLSTNAWSGTAPHSWIIASSYYMPKGASKYTASMVQFGLNTTATTMPLLKGQTINVYLIKWVDKDDDGNAQESEREIIGFYDGGYTIKGNEVNSVAGANVNTNLNIKVPIRDFADPSKKVKFQDDTYYLVALDFTAADDKVTMSVEATEAIRYRASDYAITKLGKRRTAFHIGVGDGKDWDGEGFTNSNVMPCIRLSVTPPTVGTKDITLLPINAVQVAPNPAKDEFSVFFNMPEMTSEVTMKLVDMTGKIIRTQTLENVKNDAILFNTNDVVAGTYNLVITSEQGNTVKKVVIVR
jgi:hypothetical protein